MGRNTPSRIEIINLVLIILLVLIGLKLYLDPYRIYVRELPALQEDMRTLATAVETYVVDYSHYPEGNMACSIPVALSSPIAYLKDTNYLDPMKKGATQFIRYYSKTHIFFVFQSCGPDQDYDLDTVSFAQLIEDRDYRKYVDRVKEYCYDPTNGTVSSGDILRYRQ